MHRSRVVFAGYDHFVQREPLPIARALVPVSDNTSPEHHALFDCKIIQNQFFQNARYFCILTRNGEIAHVSEVNAGEREAAPGKSPGRANQRSVAAECNDTVIVERSNPLCALVLDIDAHCAEFKELLPYGLCLLVGPLFPAVYKK